MVFLYTISNQLQKNKKQTSFTTSAKGGKYPGMILIKKKKRKTLMMQTTKLCQRAFKKA